VKQFLKHRVVKCVFTHHYCKLYYVTYLQRGFKVISCKDSSNLMSFTSKPRAATSVATRTGHLPLRNSLNTESLSACDLSPCMADARYCRDRFLDRVSHILFVEQNIMTLDPGSCDLKICSRRLCFSILVVTSTCCKV
jgi:hypothetical protein